jgi:NitT/TauT family transport system substrate-binding protein
MKTDTSISWISAVRHHARTRIEAVLFLVLLCGTGLAPDAAADDLEPVRIGLAREASAAPLFIAIAAGYFKTEGLDPQLTFLKTDPSVSAAVTSGKVDIGMASLAAPFYSYAAAHNLKIIASRSSDQTGFPMYALLVSRKAHAAGLTGVRGLPNARIGITDTNSATYYALFNIASRFGLEPGSIKTISLKSLARELGALSRGDIDAALLPFATALHSASGREPLLPLSNFAQWQQGVVFTTAKDIARRRNLIDRFMRAYQRGTAEYQLNFLSYDDGGDFIPGPHYERYLDLIARQVNISSDMLAITKTYCDRRANLDVADIKKQVQFWQDQGRLDKRIAAADLLDLSFIGEETITPQSWRR